MARSNGWRRRGTLRGLNSKIQRTLTEGEKLIRFSSEINATTEFGELSKLLEKAIPDLFHMETFSLFLIDVAWAEADFSPVSRPLDFRRRTVRPLDRLQEPILPASRAGHDL